MKNSKTEFTKKTRGKKRTEFSSPVKNRASKSLLFLIVLSFLFLSLVPTEAQAGLVPCGGENQPDCEFCHLFVLINNIWIFLVIPDANINNYLPLIPTIAALIFIIGGFYLLIAGPKPELLSKGKAILTAAVIGLVIILIAHLFISQLLVAMGIMEWTGLGTWWEFTDKCPL